MPRQARSPRRGLCALHSCTHVPGQARSHMEGCVPVIPAPTRTCPDKPGHHIEGCVPRIHCLYSTLEKTGECKRKPGVGDSVCVIESFQPCDCWCYLLVLLLINLETCKTTRFNVHIRSKEFRNSWT